ncbi:phosphoribosyltransferase [Lacihabitans sp. LS3-19]|uniref:phosphoribosyltransferase family protein n=1 Tax=Lacihabitans sp. LS3-19 TaxID=2487335 RepID=UPI0020CDEEC5|nr:phosphoribosyltransferase family protein [Lacihabitans sp. LS3-19]MCP9767338.1 phosphoribosyltransferase [Lacihabitans sp. LS3-19]
MSQDVNSKILNQSKTLQKIKRIAYQIYENNFDESEIILAGIAGEGFVFAEMVRANLQEISPLNVSIAKIIIDKSADFQPEITIESDVDTFRNKAVIIFDDVLNTGKTLAFCLRPFLSIPLKKLRVAVLVDRNHPQYPIAADYVGYSLSTTLSEHVKVILSNEESLGVYLY